MDRVIVKRIETVGIDNVKYYTNCHEECRKMMVVEENEIGESVIVGTPRCPPPLSLREPCSSSPLLG